MAKQKKIDFRNKTVKILGLVVLAFLVLVFSVRSCTQRVNLEKKIFRIARDPTWYPSDFAGKERNMTAFTNDLLNVIAHKENIQYNLYTAIRAELMEGLDRGDYDAIISSINPNPVLEAQNEYSDPFYMTGPVIVVQKNSDIKSFEDLGGQMVGIKSSSPIVFRIRDYPTILFRTYNTTRNALQSLVDDQIDAVIMDSLPAYTNTDKLNAENLKIVGCPLTDEGIRLIGKKNPASTYLMTHFNEGLKKVIEEGTYHKLLEKWGLYDTLDK